MKRDVKASAARIGVAGSPLELPSAAPAGSIAPVGLIEQRNPTAERNSAVVVNPAGRGIPGGRYYKGENK